MSGTKAITLARLRVWTEAGLRQLAAWGGLTKETAHAAGMYEVADASTVYSDFRPLPAIIIPYYDVARQPVMFERGEFCRARYLAPVMRNGKLQRYDQPAGSGVHAYFPPTVDWPTALASDAGLLLTEGEAKSLVAGQHGVPTVAIGGVWNWAQSGVLLPELAAIEWQKRFLAIVFDSDRSTNPSILAAEARLVEELGTRRGADCALIQLPQTGEHKEALDTFLQKHGRDGLLALIQSTPSLGSFDKAILALNRSIAWIEREGLVYDMEEKSFIKKDNLIKGSRFSVLKHIAPGSKKRTEPREVSVAEKWLTHPHAQRYGEILFRPGAEETILSGETGRLALNVWTGFPPCEEGDIAPFMELNDHLMSLTRADDQELPLKLMAYKMQNPHIKTPLAVILVGQQGCGKSMWADCMREAFAPYGKAVKSKSFYSEFQGWVERTLLVVINEATHEDMEKGIETLKNLISEKHLPMNEKFRLEREVETFFQMIITANKHAIASFSFDDRRMIVIGCPPKREPEFYMRMGKWKESGGPARLRYALLNWDLQGWRPPLTAPMSAEKYLAYNEGLTAVQALAEKMMTSETSQVQVFLTAATAWANNAMSGTPNARILAAAQATLEGLKHIQIRDWYTPEELALMFPAIIATTQGSKYDQTTPSGQISRELRDAGIPYLECADDPRGFKWEGRLRQFLVVANFKDWGRPVRQVDFERAMKNWPTYGMLNARRAG